MEGGIFIETLCIVKISKMNQIALDKNYILYIIHIKKVCDE